ncbi:ACT domain-containing protein, partial [Aeromicrobium sp. REDSEA-S38_B2]
MTAHVPAVHLTSPTLLLTLTGPDRSGVSTRLFASLEPFEVEVVDVEQLVVRGRLVLSVLVSLPDDPRALEDA